MSINTAIDAELAYRQEQVAAHFRPWRRVGAERHSDHHGARHTAHQNARRTPHDTVDGRGTGGSPAASGADGSAPIRDPQHHR